MRGRITSVRDVFLGSDLDESVLAGATTLPVTVDDDFDHNEGGSVVVDGDPAAYFDDPDTVGGEIVSYTVQFDPADPEAEGTLLVDPPLASDYEDGTSVNVYPPIVERLAMVIGEDQEEEVAARVPHALWDRLPSGVRDQEFSETVEYDHDETGDAVVRDVLGKEPSIDGAFIDPDSDVKLNAPPRDGAPPPVSPTPTARGGPTFIALGWGPVVNADPVTYDVHASEVSGFTPDETTKIGETKGTLFFARNLPDGSPFEYPIEATDEVEAEARPYYFRVVARDEDGPALVPGGEAVGEMQRVSGPDIAVSAITADHILAGAVHAESLETMLVLGSTIATGEEGEPRVTMNSDGLRLIGALDKTMVELSTTTGLARFTGEVIAEYLDANGAVLRGTTTVDEGGTVLLASGLQPPATPPGVEVAQETMPLLALVGGGFGLDYAANGGADLATPCFYLALKNDSRGGIVVAEYLADGTLNRAFEYFEPFPPPSSLAPHVKAAGVAKTVSGGVHRIHVMWYIAVGGFLSGFWAIRTYRQSDGAFLEEKFINSHVPGFDDPTSVGVIGSNSSKTRVVLATHGGTGDGPARLTFFNPDDLVGSGSPPAEDTLSLTGHNYARTGVGQVSKFGGITGDGTRWWLQSDVALFNNKGRAVAHDASGALVSNREFFSDGMGVREGSGLAWDGTRFWSRYDATLVKHTALDWSSGSSVHWFAHTWYDNDTSKETTISPLRSLDLSKARRARLKVSVPQFPPGIDQARLYAERAASAPAAAAMQRQDPTTHVTTNSAVVAYMLQLDEAATKPPPASSGFTNGTPSEIRSTGAGVTGQLVLRGDGTMRLPRVTTSQRNAIAATVGDEVWNVTNNRHEVYNGTHWISPSTPPGVILPYGGYSAPGGFLLCNGQLVSRTTYAALFAVCSTAYGAGDGSTTFGVPDLIGRFVQTADPSATRLSAAMHRGATGGTEQHAHDEGSLTTGTPSASLTRGNQGTTALVAGAGHTHVIDGKTGAFDSRPPFQAIGSYIIAF